MDENDWLNIKWGVACKLFCLPRSFLNNLNYCTVEASLLNQVNHKHASCKTNK